MLNINANELRLGNYIDYEKTTHIVSEISKNLVRSYWIGDEQDPIKNNYITPITDIEPILITEKLLIRLGFVKSGKIIISYVKNLDISEIKRFTILPTNSGLFYFVPSVSISWSVELKYAHQLQNMYFFTYWRRINFY